MFNKGDIVVRSGKYRNSSYWGIFCYKHHLPLDSEFTVKGHNVEAGLLTLLTIHGKTIFTLDCKMELANVTLENE